MANQNKSECESFLNEGSLKHDLHIHPDLKLLRRPEMGHAMLMMESDTNCLSSAHIPISVRRDRDHRYKTEMC